MGKVEKYKKGLSAFITSEKGQRFFNFAYSIGAAIVILGALFKILHMPGGNALLSIGMGTEVLMFMLTAFDRPPKEYRWEEVFPVLQTKKEEDRPEFNGGGGGVTAGGVAGGGVVIGGGSVIEGIPADFDGNVEGNVANAAGGGPAVIGGTTVIGGGVIGGIPGGVIGGFSGIPGGMSFDAQGSPVDDGAQDVDQAEGEATPKHRAIVPPTDFASATQLYIDQITSISTELQRLQESTEALNKVSETLLNSYKSISEHSEEINKSSTGYVEQMQTLNHNIGGLNTIYEIQLKSVSSQLDAIDRVNRGIKDIRDMFEKSAAQSTRYCEETEKMARYMQQLNTVYEKMITAMTINMYRPMMPADAMPQPSADIEPKSSENS